MDASFSPPNAQTLPSRREFDEEAYLRLHPDVAAAVRAGITDSGWQHFTLHGAREGRSWIARPDPLIGVSREISPRDEMLAGNEAHYFDVGESALRCIESALFTANRSPATVHQILDLPCGHGRVMRFLRKRFPHARLTACDLNLDGVEFCARTFGAVPLASSVQVDAIPLHADFDLIWCGSLLTHLPAEASRAFLRRFHRALQPDGLLVFTMHGRHYETELTRGHHRCGLNPAQIARLLADYQQHDFGYVDYDDQSGYGISLARPGFVMEKFFPAADWRVITYHELGWDKRQDVICLQKQAGR